MSEPQLSRKQQREVLARLRQAIITDELVTLSASVSTQVLCLDLEEESIRGLSVSRRLWLRQACPESHAQDVMPTTAFIALGWRFGLLLVSGLIQSVRQDGSIEFTFSVADATTNERRNSPRERVELGYPLTAVLETSGGEHMPCEIVIDSASATHSALLVTKADLTRQGLADDVRSVHVLDERRIAATMRRHRVIANRLRDNKPLLICLSEGVPAPQSLSQVRLRPGATITLSSLAYAHQSTVFQIDTVTTSGLLVANDPSLRLLREQEVLFFQPSTGLRFKVSRNETGLTIDLLERSLGDRVQWYNLLLDIQGTQKSGLCALQIRSIPALMVEAGSVDLVGLRRRTRRARYYEARSDLESTAPRTKTRLFRVDSSDSVVGHASMMRASQNLWAAIDNIGSSRFDGRWNRDAVAPWLRLMSEVFAGRAASFLWTFRPDHGIWTAFDLEVSKESRYLICRHEVRVLLVADPPPILLSSVSFREMTVRMFHDEIVGFPDSDHRLLHLMSGTQPTSDFDSDMLHDYGSPPNRVFGAATLPSGARVVLTTANCGEWATINGLHNCVYIVRDPRGPPAEPNDESMLLSLAWRAAFATGAHPRSLMAVNFEDTLPAWPVWVNLVISSDALSVAADYAERT